MTHLPFIAASYALAVAIAGGLATSACVRVNRAKRRLAQLDPRAGAQESAR